MLGLMHKSKILQVATPLEIQDQYVSLEEAMIMRIAEIDREILSDTFK
jgi:hypothetical protein